MFLSGSEIPQGWVVNLDPQLPGSLQQGHLDPARGRHLPLWVVSISATMSETPFNWRVLLPKLSSTRCHHQSNSWKFGSPLQFLYHSISWFSWSCRTRVFKDPCLVRLSSFLSISGLVSVSGRRWSTMNMGIRSANDHPLQRSGLIIHTPMDSHRPHWPPTAHGFTTFSETPPF